MALRGAKGIYLDDSSRRRLGYLGSIYFQDRSFLYLSRSTLHSSKIGLATYGKP